MIQLYDKFEVPGDADTRPFNLNFRKFTLSLLLYVIIWGRTMKLELNQ